MPHCRLDCLSVGTTQINNKTTSKKKSSGLPIIIVVLSSRTSKMQHAIRNLIFWLISMKDVNNVSIEIILVLKVTR